MQRQQEAANADRRRLAWAAAVLAASLCCPPLVAQDPPPESKPPQDMGQGGAQEVAVLPDIRSINGVDYLSGGIGLDESRAIHAAASRWPLQITMAEISNGRAVWIGAADVRIRDARSRAVLEFRSDGPLALVRLDPGRYTVEARFNGVALKRDVVIVTGTPQRVMIVWKYLLR
jgi:hypothetical protein